jgi:Uma2 family endonuclease
MRHFDCRRRQGNRRCLAQATAFGDRRGTRPFHFFTRAPEICVEIFSPSNTPAEIDEKRALYFDAGATEVWICNLDGSITFFLDPDDEASTSALCPAFPDRIP